MKVHLRTVGCRLNQSEIDAMARQFRQQGHEVVDDPAQADWYVVNTCAVTNEASASSRQTVRDISGQRVAIETPAIRGSIST